MSCQHVKKSINKNELVFWNLDLFFASWNDQKILLTDGIFETGAYGVPSKSQNSTGNDGAIGTIRHHIAKSQMNGFIEKSY